jgi:hypothetical protein
VAVSGGGCSTSLLYARQCVHAGLPHARRIVTIEPGGTTLRVIDPNGGLLTTVPGNSTGEISRFKAHGSRHSRLTGRT